MLADLLHDEAFALHDLRSAAAWYRRAAEAGDVGCRV